MLDKANGNMVCPAGAPGGSAGGGDGTNSGGGAGSGGNLVVVIAWAFVNGSTGSITSERWQRRNPPTGNCGGGGGGGGGNIIIYTLVGLDKQRHDHRRRLALPGNGVGTGAAGTAGTSGTVLNVVLA